MDKGTTMTVTEQWQGEEWALYQGDAADVLQGLPDNSVDLTIYSPPFGHLYVYSDSERDLGNCRNDEEFFEHYSFVSKELLRVIKPGRLTCVHVQQLIRSKSTYGTISMHDFRGDVIRHHQQQGWIFHGEITIDKNPQSQAIRTKSKQLLFVQLRKDSSWLRPALADYVLLFRKPGDNAVPIKPDLTNDEWIEWAHPLWYHIRETHTLNVTEARSDKDERHLCLARGCLVLTREHGYIPIEEVEIGDLVLTHAGRWMPVTGKRCNGAKATMRLCAQGVGELRLTPDHPLWVRDGSWVRAKDKARRSEPNWVPAENTLGSYVNSKLPPVEDSPLTEEEWWIVGRWLGDGHRGPRRHSGKRGGVGQFIISCAHTEAASLIERLGEHAGHAGRCTATQIALRNLRPEVRDVLDRCGKGAAGKRLPGEAATLCTEKAEALLAGYLSADGHYVGRYDRWCGSSVSRALILGISIVAQRARGVVASVYAGRPARAGQIQGRSVQMRQDWILTFRNAKGYRQSGWVQEDGAWKKVRKVEPAGEAEVWDISVAGDASFTAEGTVVKNCPLQLDTIERCVRLWSNAGETVLSPFAGIGSEGVVSLQHGRRFVGVELNPSYSAVAARNLAKAEADAHHPNLFDFSEEVAV
jgi:DNA modification methylase